jgi:5-(carboxyamino)imidazole ribonucleotide mutase
MPATTPPACHQARVAASMNWKPQDAWPNVWATVGRAQNRPGLWAIAAKFATACSTLGCTRNAQIILAMVGIIMGSDSDLPIMQAAAHVLEAMDVPFELTVVSAHRTPLRMVAYAQQAASRGLKLLICGAGGAAHLPGMVASLTTLPVIGVPIKSSNSIDGWDSVLSILQMPSGVPVATVALNGAKNAGILAAQILGAFEPAVSKKGKPGQRGARKSRRPQNKGLAKCLRPSLNAWPGRWASKRLRANSSSQTPKEGLGCFGRVRRAEPAHTEHKGA